MGLFSRKATAINHKELVEDKVVINRMIRAYISKSLDSMSEVGDFIIKSDVEAFIIKSTVKAFIDPCFGFVTITCFDLHFEFVVRVYNHFQITFVIEEACIFCLGLHQRMSALHSNFLEYGSPYFVGKRAHISLFNGVLVIVLIFYKFYLPHQLDHRMALHNMVLFIFDHIVLFFFLEESYFFHGKDFFCNNDLLPFHMHLILEYKQNSDKTCSSKWSE